MNAQFLVLFAMILMASSVQAAVVSNDDVQSEVSESIVHEIRYPEPRGLR